MPTIVRNDLCVPSMEHNLIPPFILREVGLVLHDTSKIHCNVPSVEYHYLFNEETGLRIPFTLDGTLSVFKTRSLTIDNFFICERARLKYRERSVQGEWDSQPCLLVKQRVIFSTGNVTVYLWCIMQYQYRLS